MVLSSASRSGDDRTSIQTRSTQTTRTQESKFQGDTAVYREFHTQGLREFLETGPEAYSASEKKEKRGGTAKFMTKFFGRSSVDNKKSLGLDSTERLMQQFRGKEQTTMGIEDLIQPSPVTNPLQCRLQPRKEDSKVSPPDSLADPDTVISPITIARNRGETARMLLGFSDDVEDEDEDQFDINESKVQMVLDAVMSSGLGAADSLDQASVTSEEEPFSNSTEDHGLSIFCEVHDPEHLIMKLARDNTFVESWRTYMDCYSTGQFNLINPPVPPALSSSFQYLPSVYPPNEPARLSMSSQYDILWPYWGQDKAGALIRIAMKQFGTKFASLSFFDEENEVFKAENGYNQPHVNRTISIAAHCLLSKDVLVILDTKKDWRFTHNPLVAGRPKIRFFAGAPMMSPCGEVLGVFAIFATRARTSFTPLQRRELAEFSSLVMTDLSVQARSLQDTHLRSTPILERNSVNNDPYRRYSIKSAVDFNDIEFELVPPALAYQKLKTPRRTKSGLHIIGQGHDSPLQPAEHTPPSSAESSHQAYDHPTGLTRHYRRSFNGDETLSGSSFYGSIAEDQHGFLPSSPRPFSSSDLTSLYPHPPNTPAHSVREEDLSTRPKFDLSVEDFMALSNDDCAEDYRSTLSIGNTLMRNRPDVSRGSISHGRHNLTTGRDNTQDSKQARNRRIENKTLALKSSSEESELIRVIPTKSSLTSFGNRTPDKRVSRVTPTRKTSSDDASSPLIDLRTPPTVETSQNRSDRSLVLYSESPSRIYDRSSLSSVSPSLALDMDGCLANAAFACAFNAQNLGYDLVYIVEIEPARSFMSDAELFSNNGLRKKILVAYGLTQPLELASEIHIRVLRCRGCELWENKQSHYKEDEYKSGFLKSLKSEGPVRFRSSGVVMGAFRKPRPVTERTELSPTAEMDRFVEFSKVLKGILFPKFDAKHQSKSNTELATPTAYPASEAREVGVGKYPFDAGRY